MGVSVDNYHIYKQIRQITDTSAKKGETLIYREYHELERVVRKWIKAMILLQAYNKKNLLRLFLKTLKRFSLIYKENKFNLYIVRKWSIYRFS